MTSAAEVINQLLNGMPVAAPVLEALIGKEGDLARRLAGANGTRNLLWDIEKGKLPSEFVEQVEHPNDDEGNDEAFLPPFPLEALPPWLRDYVGELSVQMQVPVGMAAGLSLAAISAAVAGKATVEVRPGWQEVLVLWVLIVADPATRKSPLFRAALSTLREHERREQERIAPAVQEAQSQRRIAEARLSKAEKLAAEATDAEKQQKLEEVANRVAELRDIVVPPDPRMFVDDATPEQIAVIAAENHGRISVLSPEADVFAIMIGRYSNNGASNLEVFLKGHAGDSHKVDRKKSQPLWIPRLQIPMAITCQPDVIRGLNQQDGFRGRGLLGRFLYEMSASTVGRRQIAAPPVRDHVRILYEQKLSALLQVEFSEEGHVLRFSSEAEACMRGFEEWLEPKLAKQGEYGAITDFAGKLSGLVARLAALLHMAQEAGSDSPWTRPVAVSTMEDAIKIGKYALDQAMAAYEEMGISPGESRQGWRKFLRIWWNEFKEVVVLSSTLLPIATEPLEAVLAGTKTDTGKTKRLGHLLYAMRDRSLGSYTVRYHGPDRNGRHRFSLSKKLSALSAANADNGSASHSPHSESSAESQPKVQLSALEEVRL